MDPMMLKLAANIWLLVFGLMFTVFGTNARSRVMGVISITLGILNLLAS
jgi:hypothetical protein